MGVWTNDGSDIYSLLPKYGIKEEYLKFGIECKILALSKQGPKPVSKLGKKEKEEPEHEEPEDNVPVTEVHEPIC